MPIKAILFRDVRSPFVDVGCGDVDFEHGEVSPVRLDSSMDISTTLRQKNIIWLHINQTNIPRQVSHIFQILEHFWQMISMVAASQLNLVMTLFNVLKCILAE